MNRAMDALTASAVTSGHVPYVFFVRLDFSTPLCVCSAGYDIQWNGITWLGLSVLGSIDAIQEQASLEAIGLRLTMSGIPSDLVALMMVEQYQGKPCQVWFAPLRDDMQLLSTPVRSFSGRMDVPDIEAGDTATITVAVESRMVAWERAKVRRYNNEDQQARYPGDRGFEFVAQMVEKTLSWGR